MFSTANCDDRHNSEYEVEISEREILKYENKLNKWESLLNKIELPDDLSHSSKSCINDKSINKEKIYDDINQTTNKATDEIRNTKVCQTCNGALECSDDLIICKNCGEIQKLSSDIYENNFCVSVSDDHTISRSSSLAFRIVGTESRLYNRSLTITCSDYNIHRKNSDEKDMSTYVYQHDVPENVKRCALDIIGKIKSARNIKIKDGKLEEGKYIFRGNGKKKIMAGAISYSYAIHNIRKSRKEIAEIFGIDELGVLRGERKIQEFGEKKIVDIPTLTNSIEDYVDKYFCILEIPEEYKEFVKDLINKIEHKVKYDNNSRPSTKAAGAIYLLISRIPQLREKIGRDVVEKKCCISKSTFMKYYKKIDQNHEKVKKVFKRHRIPMPNKWKKKAEDGST
jgi:hypothetical protein